jgi:tRNA nucleotidyltransferase (CCA-adding enzyme)
MSDYMFMLESHLSPDQNRVVAEVQAAAAEANVSLFLTGGAMRDMLGGFAIRALDFTVEGHALKVARAIAKKPGIEILSEDEHRKSTELLFPGGVRVAIAMARQEHYAKPGARPQIAPATIHEDLRSRDFTVNAIALSLNRASRGLLLDPTNGLGDLERKEIRAVHHYVMYDDPGRILRLIRLRVRLGFTVDERTKSQYENVREAELEKKIPPRRLFEELRHIADDPNPAAVLTALEEEKLLQLFSPALSGAALNLPGFAKWHKAHQIVPFGVQFPVETLGLFLFFLTEKLTPKERSALVSATEMRKEEEDVWHKLEGRAKKLERDLKSATLRRPSQVYHALSKARGDEILFLLARSDIRLVQDRIRNYLQKYLPTAQEVTDDDVQAQGLQPGTPKFQKAKEELIAARLNARPKKPVEEEPAPPPPPEMGLRRGFSKPRVS